MRPPRRKLDQVQRWMQAVITHPDGVVAGMRSETAREELEVPPDGVEEVILRSRRLTSIERLQIYGNAYYARLLECLRQEYPALVHALGEETFDGFAFGYLQAYPSRSYTLAELGRHFPQYLTETRPAAEADAAGQPDWADFLIDLATVERTYSEVFDGPGIEGQRILQASDVAGLAPGEWSEACLIPVPCLRLLTLGYPVHEYISAVRRKAEAVIPEPSRTYLVVTRREFVVRRCAVSPVEYALLSTLVAGESVGAAIGRIASDPEADREALAKNLHGWFRQWAAAAFFQTVQLPRVSRESR